MNHHSDKPAPFHPLWLFLVLSGFLTGFLFCMIGLGVSLTGIGAFVGIPLILLGVLVLFGSLVLLMVPLLKIARQRFAKR